ncbi:MAG: RidA family protein [Gallicola sp.]|nr:RidA family protein [Gallicola sp.]
MGGFNAVLGRNTDNAPKFDSCSQTVAFSHYNNFSAQLPIDPKTGNLVEGGVQEQAKQCFENIKAIVESIDHVMTDVIRISVFLADIEDNSAVNEVYKSYFPTYLPTLTTVAVNALPKGALVMVDAQISCGEGTIPNEPQAGDLVKLVNHTTNAPTFPLSSQIVAFSHYTNVTTQLPVDPKVGRIVAEDIKGQAAQCLKNIKAILESVDVPLDDIVKVTIFLKDLADLDAVNEVYTTFFPDSGIARAVGYFPARTVVEAKALPLHALVSMEAVVSYGDGTPPQLIEDRHGLIIEANNTDKAPKCPVSTQTVAFSHYNHISAQLPMTADKDGIVEGGVKEQAAQCLQNIKEIVESIDHAMEDVVKVNVYLKNIDDIDALEEAYKEFFADGVPARRIVGVANLPHDALVQIDAIVGNTEGTPPIV